MSQNIGIISQDINFYSFKQEKINEFHSTEFKFQKWISAEEFWRKRNKKNLSLLLIEIELSGMNGLELTKLIKRQYPEIKIILISSNESIEDISEVLSSGAIGYVLQEEVKQLDSIIFTVLSGGGVFSPNTSKRVIEYIRNLKQPDEKHLCFTEREWSIIKELMLGNGIDKISQKFGTSKQTVRKQLSNLYKKFGVKNQIELINKLSEYNLID